MIVGGLSLSSATAEQEHSERRGPSAHDVGLRGGARGASTRVDTHRMSRPEELSIMADDATSKAIEDLKRENAELQGLALATGVILTQLLQSICKRELNPHAAAGRIMTSAREAVEGFTAATKADPVMKKRALDAVQQYEDQIRSVLAV